MEKRLSSVLVIFFLLAVPISWGQVSSSVPSVAVPGNVLEKAGVVAATQGTVQLTTPGQAGRIAESGQPVFIGDEVTTDGQGHLQILLLDQTVFTIGPNTAITIDEFVFDPKTQNGKMEASITKGIFRYVSGKIAAKKPGNVKINLPTATIGIRGTIVAGEAAPKTSFAMLLGPGENNNADARIGSFVMEATSGSALGEQREVNRTGFGVQTDASGSLSGVFQVPAATVNRLAAGLVPPPNQAPPPGAPIGQQPPGQAPPPGAQPPPPGSVPPPSGTQPPPPPLGSVLPPPGTQPPPPPQGATLHSGTSATNLSGQTNANALDMGRTINTLNNYVGRLDATSQKIAQDSATSTLLVADGISKMEELTRIAQGVFHYAVSAPYNGFANGFFATWDIHFGQGGAIGGGNSRVRVAISESIYDSAPIQFQRFAPAGQAVFSLQNIAGAEHRGTFNNINITLTNRNGVTAETGKIHVDYTGGSGYTSMSGSADASGPRLPQQST